MAKPNAKQTATVLDNVAPISEPSLAQETETSAAALNTAPAGSNFIGSIEEAYDEAEKQGEKDGEGSAALLATGIIAAKHGKVLRGKGKDADKEFQANIMALRLKYVAGFNKIAAVKNPCNVIAVDPDVKSKAYKANKKQANKLGTYVKAGCLFATGEEAEAYINRVVVAVGKTDYSNAKNRESTFERVKSILTKIGPDAKDESDEALAERCLPATKDEPAATAEETTTTATVEPVVTAAEALGELASALSVLVAKHSFQPGNAAKLNAMVAEMNAMAKMLHAADKAEATAEEKKEPEVTAETKVA